MKVALMAKNKISFVDGSILPPLPSDPLYGAWQRCNTMALAWIHRSVSESILQSVLWIDKTFEVWKNLKDRFCQADVFRIFYLHEEIFKLHQGTLSVTDYFTQLKILWDEFENSRPNPICKCSDTMLVE
jgi:hypothetical protein